MKYLTIAFLVFLSSCRQDLTIIYETKNIEKGQKAVLALNPAGLGGGDVYYVHILGADENANENDLNSVVFIVDYWDSVLPRDTTRIKVEWLHDTLKIAYDSKMRIYKQVIKTRDNVILYEPIKP